MLCYRNQLVSTLEALVVIMSGSITRGKADPSQSLQMMERPLMTPDELKTIPKGNFIVTKTGSHPMRTKLKLFFKWGIKLDKIFEMEEKSARKVSFVNKDDIEKEIVLSQIQFIDDGENMAVLMQEDDLIKHMPVRVD